MNFFRLKFACIIIYNYIKKYPVSLFNRFFLIEIFNWIFSSDILSPNICLLNYIFFFFDFISRVKSTMGFSCITGTNVKQMI